MEAAKPRVSVRGLLVAIALLGVTLACLRHFQPMGREAAIRVARRHALEVYPGIHLDDYAISAPPRCDWWDEWSVSFRHQSRDAGFLIDVAGGDAYNGVNLRVSVDNEWGMRR